jgi:hypothetical protein
LSRTLQHAPGEERHFALVENVPIQPRLANYLPHIQPAPSSIGHRPTDVRIPQCPRGRS